MKSRSFWFALLGALLAALPLQAQIPGKLLQSVFPPPIGAEGGGHLASSVGIDGSYIVAGAPEVFMAGAFGGAKVFDSTSGALLFELPKPVSAPGYGYGSTVAISGTRVVAGCSNFDQSQNKNVGFAAIYDLSSATPTAPIAVLLNPSAEIHERFGAVVAISGSRVAVAAPDDRRTGTPGSVYVYDLSNPMPTTPVATLHNPGGANYDGYAESVSISGTRVVVSSHRSLGGLNSGTVYIYDLNSPLPDTPVLSVDNPGPAENFFGSPVAISDSRVVVGASAERVSGVPGNGKAYVFDLTSTTPAVPVAILSSPTAIEGNTFATALAMAGTRVAVEAYVSSGASAGGKTYVYDLGSATPTVATMTLANPPPSSFDAFVTSVAISATQVVAGVPFDDTGATDAGSAYVYNLGSASTTPVLVLNSPGPSSGDGFGTSVSISGMRMVVGAPEEGFTGPGGAGHVYVYDLGAGLPAAPIVIENPAPEPYVQFGKSVSISGTRVVVGAPLDSEDAFNTGIAYVYDLASATPAVPILTLHNPTPDAYDFFGWAVAIHGSHVVVGAPDDIVSTGVAYVYDLNSATPSVPAATLLKPVPDNYGSFGASVSISDHLVVVGAPGLIAQGMANVGAAFVFDLDSATPATAILTLNNPSPGSEDSFGSSVAISSLRVMVGAPGDDTGATDAGSAYEFDLASATPTVPVAEMHNPDTAVISRYGRPVAISGTRAVVGASLANAGAIYVGRAYVYDLAGTTPGVPVLALNNPSPAEAERFGGAVAIEGATVAIGTPGDHAVAPYKGAVYIFGANPNDQDNSGLLDSWELAHFGNATGHHATDDDEQDGLNNLLEEAFGTDPLQPDAAVPAPVDEDGYLTITVAKHPGVTYLVQSASSPDPAAFTAADTTVLVNDANTLKVRDNLLIGTTPGRFLRVEVTAAP